MRIEYHPAIEGEVRVICDFYESRSVGLGKDFVDAFDAQMSKIAAMPERWMIARGDTRRALMNRFPFVIGFRILPGGVIRVTVVKHERRHPSFGRTRL